MPRFSAVCTLALCLIVAIPAFAAGGKDNANNNATPRGLLDRPINLPERAAGPAQQAATMRELRREARKERRQLKRLSDSQLRRKAQDESNRLAQLVLAERLAEEAQRWANIPNVGNDALSEALQWFAIAARRGTPGTAPVDQVLPSFPLRVLRRQ